MRMLIFFRYTCWVLWLFFSCEVNGRGELVEWQVAFVSTCKHTSLFTRDAIICAPHTLECINLHARCKSTRRHFRKSRCLSVCACVCVWFVDTTKPFATSEWNYTNKKRNRDAYATSMPFGLLMITVCNVYNDSRHIVYQFMIFLCVLYFCLVWSVGRTVFFFTAVYCG